jgi:hypothetical protein
MLKGAVLTVFKERMTPERLRDVVNAFDEGRRPHGQDVPSAASWPSWSPACRACASRSRA